MWTWILINQFVALIVALAIARKKHREWLALALALTLSWLGVIVLLFIPPKKARAPAQQASS